MNMLAVIDREIEQRGNEPYAEEMRDLRAAVLALLASTHELHSHAVRDEESETCEDFDARQARAEAAMIPFAEVA